MKRKTYTDDHYPKCNTRLIWLYMFSGKNKIKVGKFCINCKYFEPYNYFEQQQEQQDKPTHIETPEERHKRISMIGKT